MNKKAEIMPYILFPVMFILIVGGFIFLDINPLDSRTFPSYSPPKGEVTIIEPTAGYKIDEFENHTIITMDFHFRRSDEQIAANIDKTIEHLEDIANITVLGEELKELHQIMGYLIATLTIKVPNENIDLVKGWIDI